MELGDFELHAGPKTRDANGEGFEPVRSRIVLSRFRVIEETSSVGHFVDGWQYELFATNLDAGAWPAPELVAQYFGRAAQENRFAQEDRELGLDHVFSYNLPGQELACLFGLMVGNLHLTRGFAQHTPPTEMPAPVPRVAVETMRVADAAPLATASGEAVSVEPDTVEMPTDASPETIAPSANPPAAALADMTLPATAASPAATTAAVAALTVDEVRDLFDGLDWGSLLKRLGSAWQRAPSGDALICSEGAILHASKVIPSRHAGGLPSLRMLGSAPVCGQCPQRLPCAQTESPHFAKKVSVPLTAEQGERIDVVLSAKTNRQRRAPHPDAPRPLSPTKPTSPRHQLPTVLPRLGSPTPGPYAPSEYRLLPAEFRHAFRRACQEVRITVAVPPIPAPPGQRPLGIADTDAERQRRRRTWSARLRDNELPAAVDIALLVTGPIHALAALGLAAREPAKSRPDHGKI
jgi:hypothetical protein